MNNIEDKVKGEIRTEAGCTALIYGVPAVASTYLALREIVIGKRLDSILHSESYLLSLQLNMLKPI